MKKALSVVLTIAIFFSALVGFQPLTLVYADIPVYMDSTKSVEERVEDLITRMDLAEKIGQMLQVERANLNPGDVTNYNIGSVLSGGGSWPNGSMETNYLDDWVELTDRFQEEALATELMIPILFAVDAVHGHNNVLGATIFPHNIGLGATKDTALVKNIASAVSKEVRATGVHWTFAPFVGVPQDYRWGRTYEGFSENVDLVSDMGVAFTQGLQGDTIDVLSRNTSTIATLKHYIGEGQTVNGANKGNVTEYTAQELIDQFAKPYEDAIAAGARTVMMSYNSINGQRCHGNKDIIDYLKNDPAQGGLGFTGIVISDYNGIDDLPGNFKQDIKDSVNAGIDMFMTTDKWKSFVTNLTDLVNQNEVSMDRINDAVSRIIRVKFESGIFENPFADDTLASVFGSEEHRELAREAVRKSLVLLKNDNEILADLKNMDKIFVAGRSANNIGRQSGGWTISWQGKPDEDQADNMLIGPSTQGTTIWQGTKEVAAGITGPNDKDGNAMVPGNEIVTGNGKELKYNKHGRGSVGYDVAIAVIGENPYAEGNGDAGDLTLSAEDIATLNNIKTENPEIPIIVVLVSGRPMDIADQVEDWDGLVAAWLPGTEGAGVADVLFNDEYEFTGKTPYTWPWYMEQFPMPIEAADALFPYGFGLTKNTSSALPVKPERPLPEGHDISNRLEAENVFRALSLSKEGTSDVGGGENVGWTSAGQWYDYVIDVPEDGLYEIDFRVSSSGGAGQALVVLNSVGDALGSPLVIDDTGGWQNWATKTNTVALEEGVQVIRISLLNGNWNFNWMEFRRVGDIPDGWGSVEEPEPIVIPSSPVTREDAVEVWYSSENNAGAAWYYSPKSMEGKYALDKQANLDLVVPTGSWDVQAITVDPTVEYQEILGIGSSMEESTVYNLYKMSEGARNEVLTKLVAENEANMSLMRLTIGTADFTGKEFYTYADLPYDEMPKDEDIEYYLDWLDENFSIQKDIDYNIIAAITKMKQINPNIKFFASSWTPPGWMKTVNASYQFNDLNLKGGKLVNKFIPAAARYYRLFVEAYAELGIDIYGMTLQNEPELEINYPSCGMTAQQELLFAQALKAEFESSVAEGKLTEEQIPKIWVFDHNFSSGVSFLSGIMGDDSIDGAAFHDYSGEPSAMTQVHNLFPDKTVMMSERSVWGTAGADRIAQYLRNWSISYNSWVTMLDSDIYPEQWTGTPDPTMLIRDSGNADEYWMCPEYYITAQFSKFVKPGAVRIDSNYGSKATVTNVAFKNPDGNVVVVVINQNKEDKPFKILCNGEQISAVIPAGTVATYIFEPGDGSNVIEPLKIPASNIKPGEEIVASSGVGIAAGGDILDIDTGDYFDFYLEVPETGYYSFDSWFENYDEVNDTTTPGSIFVKLGDDVLAHLQLDPAPSWNKGMWRQARVNIPLEAGVHMIRFQVENAASVTIGGTNISKIDCDNRIPGKIEAESFINTIGPVALDNGSVGYWNVGEVLVYDVDIQQAGTYNVLYRYASGSWDSCVRIFLDDVELTSGDLWLGASDNDTGAAWGIFKTHQFMLNFPTEGRHTLKLMSSGSGDHNLDYIAIGSYISAQPIDGNIIEGAEDGRQIRVELCNTESAVVTPDAITLNNLPEGVSIVSSSNVTDSEVIVTLSGNASEDYDTDREVTVSYEMNITSVDAIILESKVVFKANADIEELQASWSATNGVQESMDDESITLTLAGGFFKESGLSGITLGGDAAAAGITIQSVELIDLTHVKLNLSWNGTPYYEDISIIVNVPAGAYTDSRGGTALTDVLISQGVTGGSSGPGVLTAEDIYMMSGAVIADDAAGGKKLTGVGSGDWIEFKVDIPEDGVYVVDLRIGVPSTQSTLLELKSNGSSLKTINMPQYWANWVTVRTAVTLEEGEQIIRLSVLNAADFQFKSLKIVKKPNPLVVPGRIEAEDFYDTNKGLISDMKVNNEVVGYVLDYLNANDWMRYSVNVQKPGVYQVTYRYSTQQSGVSVALRKAGEIITQTTLVSTGDWQSYSTASGEVTLLAGTYDIELLDIGDGFNIDWIEFTLIEEFCTVQYNANGGTGSIPAETKSVSDEITLASATAFTAPSGKRFKQWNTQANGTGTAYNANAQVVLEGDLILYAIWENIPTSGGSPVVTPPALHDLGDVKGQVNVDPQTGILKSNIEKSTIDTAFDNAKEDTKGNKSISIELPVSEKGLYELVIPADALSTGTGKRSINLITDVAQVALPDQMLSNMGLNENDDAGISLSSADKLALPEDLAEKIGDKPLIQVKLTVNGVQTKWDNPAAPVTISIPYEPTAEELKDPEHIVIWYIDGEGNVHSVPTGRYNAVTGCVEFTTTHFSLYAVTYVKKSFNDLDSISWAKKPIEVLASKGVITGTDDDNYEPASNITRADFIAMLVNTLGLDAEFTSNFDDVAADAYYYEAVGIAKALGVTYGGGNNKLFPDTELSRQDMIVLTARALEVSGKLTGDADTSVLEKFTDKDQVADYAVNAMSKLISESLIVGSGNILSPKSATTKASASVLLYKIYNMN